MGSKQIPDEAAVNLLIAQAMALGDMKTAVKLKGLLNVLQELGTEIALLTNMVGATDAEAYEIVLDNLNETVGALKEMLEEEKKKEPKKEEGTTTEKKCSCGANCWTSNIKKV